MTVLADFITIIGNRAISVSLPDVDPSPQTPTPSVFEIRPRADVVFPFDTGGALRSSAILMFTVRNVDIGGAGFFITNRGVGSILSTPPGLSTVQTLGFPGSFLSGINSIQIRNIPVGEVFLLSNLYCFFHQDSD